MAKNNFLNVTLTEILGGVVVCLLGVLLYMSNGQVAEAQGEAKAAMVKANNVDARLMVVEQQMTTMTDNVAEIKKAVLRMAETSKQLSDIVISHDKDIEYTKKRIDDLEEKLK